MLPFHDPINDWIQNLTLQSGWPVSALLRLVLAMVAGGLVGLEREMRGRQAGFRTNILVCLGSALVMLVSSSVALATWPTPGKGVNLNIDPARIAYGVMTGIGFLGAGAIIKTGATIRGLTTAASLWCVAAIGLAAGFGMYLVTFMATALVLLALWLLDKVENILPHLRYRDIVVRRAWKPGCIAETVQYLKTSGLYVADVSFQRTADLDLVDITLMVGFKHRRQYYKMERQLQDEDGYELLATREP